MKTLILGASGVTGKHLVEQLLQLGHEVTAVVRSPKKLPKTWHSNSNLKLVKASVLDLSDAEMQELTKGVDAIASCLGHNLTLKGMFGKPRKLVRDVASRITKGAMANSPTKPVKYVLMNTAGNSNRGIKEKVSFGQKIVVGLIRFLLPPHRDNEQAADYLQQQIKPVDLIQWVVVRPDGLINEESFSEYETHASPTRSAIFNAGKVSRINVGHFMASLIDNNELWQKWQGQMPVMYNKEG